MSFRWEARILSGLREPGQRPGLERIKTRGLGGRLCRVLTTHPANSTPRRKVASAEADPSTRQRLTKRLYSDISVTTEMTKLTDTQRQFILHWGEMGTRWGISRTVAQIHALLYLSQEAMNAEQIATILNVARSNVSTSIRELEGWGIVHAVHVLGDRREHYECLKDVSQMFVLILEQRKRRELDPTVQLLRRCLAQLEQDPADAYTRERLQEMAQFFEATSEAYEQIHGLSPEAWRGLLKARGKLKKLAAGLH